MMIRLGEKLRDFANNRWLVFVCAMWIQSWAGIGYLFGSISPVIKSRMGYNQRQIAMLGVAKDLGDSVGFLAGSLSEFFPIWGISLIGAIHNFFGYGLVWLIVTHRLPSLPLWVLCIAIYIGTNGETFFNTAALVSCIQNFPKSRGPIVGILKGFAGLSGAILTQIYAMINAPDQASLLFMVAVGPSMVALALMFIVRPVGGHRQVRPSDSTSFLFTYMVCLLLAAYMMGVLLVQDLFHLNQTVVTLLSIVLILLIFIPIVIPILLVFFTQPTPPEEESLLPELHKEEDDDQSNPNGNEIVLSEVEDEKSSEIDLLSSLERHKRMAQLQAKLVQAAAEGAVRIKGRSRKGPRRGEDFTLLQALRKADFWLLFFSLLLASGSGLTIIDNLGQIVQSLGYSTDRSIYVSMISIFNFLGRVGGGYFSEIIVRKYAYPRQVAMAIFQLMMAVGLLYYSFGLPGEIYVITVLTGLGYGAHWAILPAAASELFGLKSFGALYNFLTLANPAGSLIFSGAIASGIYDHYAEEQARMLGTLKEESLICKGLICYSLTCAILSGICVVAAMLSLIVVYRTKRVYTQLYGKLHN